MWQKADGIVYCINERTFQYFIDVLSVELYPSVILYSPWVVWKPCLSDVYGDIVIFILNPVQNLSKTKWCKPYGCYAASVRVKYHVYEIILKTIAPEYTSLKYLFSNTNLIAYGKIWTLDFFFLIKVKSIFETHLGHEELKVISVSVSNSNPLKSFSFDFTLNVDMKFSPKKSEESTKIKCYSLIHL